MRTILMNLLTTLAFLATPAAIAQGEGQEGDLVNAMGVALASLEEGFPDGEAAAFDAFLQTLPDGVDSATIGQMLYARKHWDKAAWFFGTDALTDLSDAASLNNFSAMLVQIHAQPGDALLDAAYAASQMAVALDGDNAAYWNNLGNVARHLGRIDEAVDAARRATELASDEPLYWANLARALEAAGDSSGAAKALVQARMLYPNGMAYLAAHADLPTGGVYAETLADNCNVDFHCQEICPRSIIGGIMSVTCEMAGADAQLACMAGEPYPTGYDCREDLPEYGILIPGLNAGFSACVPNFCIHVLVDGQGNVDMRAEGGLSLGPISSYLRADGHFAPDGGVSFDNIGGGMRLSLIDDSPAADFLSKYGQPPAQLELEALDGGPAAINIEAYNAGVISY